jgi:hypothetical protein
MSKPKIIVTIQNVSTFDYYNNLLAVELIEFLQEKRCSISIETKKTKEAIITIENLPKNNEEFKPAFDLKVEELKDQCSKLNFGVIVGTEP